MAMMEQKQPLVNMLSLTKQLFDYRIKYLAGINSNPEERKAEMSMQCHKIISSYLVNSLYSRSNPDSEELKQIFDSVIEFCVKTEMEEFLFTQLKESLKYEFKLWIEFLGSLEEWIEDKQITRIPNHTINEIIEHFNQNQKFHILQKLIVKLNLENMDTSSLL